ncbi:lipoyl domain-containing protein [Emcibacter sp.]|uniref:lipoyl domain-containing protein n=1 Tax=Emcibacter sp. TaxID=1979954 RepID=UPI003A8CBE8C
MDIIIPEDLWEEDVEGTLLAWLYDEGASVAEGEAIVEIMTEKVQHEICAPAAGKLVRKVEEETLVNKGDVIGRIEG